MNAEQHRLALHTWTLESTPLAEVLRIAQETGWDAVELRRKDFERALAAGWSTEQVLDLVRASGVPVAAVGVAAGWLFAAGAEQARLFAAMAESCRAAVALGCDVVMSAVGEGRGTVRQAAASLRAAGDVVGEHGLRLAFEFSSLGAQINTLERAREVLAAADHPRCGLLLDAYHLQRSGRPGRGFEDVPGEEICYVQYSDVPADSQQPGLDRLPPGQGVVAFREVFALLAEKGYTGYLSYEAPNPAAWARDPREVAREALLATRALLPPLSGSS
jgi:sugar phosphate isomerase/epimerase